MGIGVIVVLALLTAITWTSPAILRGYSRRLSRAARHLAAAGRVGRTIVADPQEPSWATVVVLRTLKRAGGPWLALTAGLQGQDPWSGAMSGTPSVQLQRFLRHCLAASALQAPPGLAHFALSLSRRPARR